MTPDVAQTATKLGPENAQAWNLRGQSHTSLGDIAEGVRCYEQAVKLQPGMREAWINMGLAEKEVSPKCLFVLIGWA